MKHVVIVGDGMADHPVAELGGRTCLEAARHPHMDFLAGRGQFGLCRTVPKGMPPGSDTANLSVFGYDPAVYYSGRSSLEAAGMGVELGERDVAYRCNLVHLSGGPALSQAHMADYCAGEIESGPAAELIEHMNARFAADGLRFYPGTGYRHCLVLRDAQTGAGLTPPHDISGRAVASFLPREANAALLTSIMTYSFDTLGGHPVNAARRAQGLAPGNAVWLWGEGRRPRLPGFAEKYGLRGAVISAVDLIHGIGACAGLARIDVPGATGNYHTNYGGKARAAIDALRGGHDFVYVHIEAPDECGHRREVHEKVRAIEDIDNLVIAPILAYLADCGQPYTVLVLPDHPTPLDLMTHTDEPVPFALYRSGDACDNPVIFTEVCAARTGLYVEHAHTLLGRMVGR